MLKYPVLLLLGFYKKCISPLLPPACRYTPTCSEYMADAVKHRGAIRGVWMGIRRLARCQPFGGSGYDPVPGAPERPEYATGAESEPATSGATSGDRTEAAG